MDRKLLIYAVAAYVLWQMTKPGKTEPVDVGPDYGPPLPAPQAAALSAGAAAVNPLVGPLVAAALQGPEVDAHAAANGTCNCDPSVMSCQC